MSQWYCIVGGQKYGPVDAETLRQWLATGQAKPSDLVWTEGMAQWAPASTVSEPSGASAPGPAAPVGGPPPIPTQPVPYATQFAKPHRGTMILIFGILGFLVCVLFGIAAWVMGNNDLREMDQGLMDPAGRDMTKAGKIVGMVSTILAIVGVAIFLFFGIFAGASSFHSVRFR